MTRYRVWIFGCTTYLYATPETIAGQVMELGDGWSRSLTEAEWEVAL